MATYTLTEVEHTDNDAENTKKFNTDRCTYTLKERRSKVNKNAVPRISRLLQTSENSDKQSEPPRVTEKTQVQTPLSSPELEGDADSAIGSDVMSVLEEEMLPAEMHNLDFQQHIERLTLQDFSFIRSVSIFSGQPTFVVPKVPVRPTRPFKITNTNNTVQKQTLQHYKTEQERESSLENVSAQNCPITREISNVSTDGPQSDIVPSTIPDSIQPSTSTFVASSRLPGGMSDFVILHTDADIQAVCFYMAHLLKDIGIPDLTVDSFSDIDAGKSQFQSLATLHDTYRYILTYITDNLKSDNCCRFLQEIILTFGLREANGKEDRVVPVFTQNKYCGIPEISIINGLQYFKYNSGTSFMKTLYIDRVKKLVEKGRSKFP